MPELAPRRYPRLYERFLRFGEPPELRDARQRANTYKRASLRDAFDAGWHAWRIRVTLGDGYSSPLLSSFGRSAWRRGLAAREAYETAHPTLEE